MQACSQSAEITVAGEPGAIEKKGKTLADQQTFEAGWL